MDVISGEEFQTRIYSDNAETISDFIVEINSPLNIDLEKVNLFITFSNLKFIGKQIQFYKYKKECLHRFRFEECLFESNISIESDFEDITFISNTFNCDKFTIENKEISILTFDKKNEFGQNEILENNNTFTKGIFKIYNCEISNLSIDSLRTKNNSKFEIEASQFKDLFVIQKSFIDEIEIFECQFEKDFEYSCDYNKTTFIDCDFFKSIIFKSPINLKSSTLSFEKCTFHRPTDFNQFRIHKLRLKVISFLDTSSFQDTIFDVIEIDRTTFLKTSWFDNIKIKEIDNCDRRTIRTIKQELQKTENRIDFNKFRNYELSAHYKELKFCKNPIDTSILWATKWSSHFGNWFWAFCFTLIIALIFFSLFYTFENINKTVNLHNWPDFIFGYFRFFLITDFKNEYYNSGESVLKFNYFISLFPFIIGKIAVAFGLYEMIQSFRKFKA